MSIATRLAGPIAFIKAWWMFAVSVIAAVTLSYNVGYCSGKSAGKASMEKAIADANVRTFEQKAHADEIAATQRITDTIAVNRQEETLRHAIEQIPDTVPDAARIALGCARLRAANPQRTDLPGVCRAGGGAQASPAR